MQTLWFNFISKECIDGRDAEENDYLFKCIDYENIPLSNGYDDTFKHPIRHFFLFLVVDWTWTKKIRNQISWISLTDDWSFYDFAQNL